MITANPVSVTSRLSVGSVESCAETSPPSTTIKPKARSPVSTMLNLWSFIRASVANTSRQRKFGLASATLTRGELSPSPSRRLSTERVRRALRGPSGEESSLTDLTRPGDVANRAGRPIWVLFSPQRTRTGRVSITDLRPFNGFPATLRALSGASRALFWQIDIASVHYLVY